jgi:uronate dehydrogenase
MKSFEKPLLLTGASGNLGRMLARALAEQGWTLRLTDINRFPIPTPPGAVFVKADLSDGQAVERLVEGCRAILHFGAVSVEQPFEELLGPNICGLHHIYAAARRHGCRVIFASSNHVVGFHERPLGSEVKLDGDCDLRPDGYYGLSKAYGELMGRMYWDKHGVENVNIRIGSCCPRPVDARMLSTWLSFGDLVRLVTASVTAPHVGHAVIWGTSNNPATFWGLDHRERVGWQPLDSAEDFRSEVEGKLSDNSVTERYQGGAFAAIEYSRATPSPSDLFNLS